MTLYMHIAVSFDWKQRGKRQEYSHRCVIYKHRNSEVTKETRAFYDDRLYMFRIYTFMSDPSAP